MKPLMYRTGDNWTCLKSEWSFSLLQRLCYLSRRVTVNSDLLLWVGYVLYFGILGSERLVGFSTLLNLGLVLSDGLRGRTFHAIVMSNNFNRAHRDLRSCDHRMHFWKEFLMFGVFWRCNWGMDIPKWGCVSPPTLMSLLSSGEALSKPFGL